MKFYSGTINSSNCSSGKHEVTNDDGDVETPDLSKEQCNYLRNQVAFCHAVQLMRKAVRKHHNPSSVNIVIVDDPLDNRFKESKKMKPKVYLIEVDMKSNRNPIYQLALLH